MRSICGCVVLALGVLCGNVLGYQPATLDPAAALDNADGFQADLLNKEFSEPEPISAVACSPGNPECNFGGNCLSCQSQASCNSGRCAAVQRQRNYRRAAYGCGACGVVAGAAAGVRRVVAARPLRRLVANRPRLVRRAVGRVFCRGCR